MKCLIPNIGSTSFKYRLLDMPSETVLAEGRKFGIGVGLISQRPGKLDQDVLSQCMTQFILRIVNPIDQNTIASAVESASKDTLAELPSLSRGQAVVAGSALNAPALIVERRQAELCNGQALFSGPAVQQGCPSVTLRYSLARVEEETQLELCRG